MNQATEEAWDKAWAPLVPPEVDHLVPSRRALFDAGRAVGLKQGYDEGYRDVAGVWPLELNPYEVTA